MLSTVDIAAVYVMLVGLTLALVMLGSVVIFNESLSITKLLGFAAILGGILLIVIAQGRMA